MWLFETPVGGASRSSLSAYNLTQMNTQITHEFIYPNYKMLRKFNLENLSISSWLGFTKTPTKLVLSCQVNFPDFEKVILEGFLKKNDERMDFIRAKIENKNGYLVTIPFERQDSSMIHQYSLSDCLIIRDPFESENKNGDEVKIIRFPNNV